MHVKSVSALFVLILVSLFSCQRSGGPEGLPDAQQDPQALLIRRGKAQYVSNCTACHHPSDPRRVGAVGPEIAHSSLQLLQTKVLSNTYPEGYKPKRDSKLMVKLPHLEADIPALHAFLNSFPKE